LYRYDTGKNFRNYEIRDEGREITVGGLYKLNSTS
jgi:hypothetical protein